MNRHSNNSNHNGYDNTNSVTNSSNNNNRTNNSPLRRSRSLPNAAVSRWPLAEILLCCAVLLTLSNYMTRLIFDQKQLEAHAAHALQPDDTRAAPVSTPAGSEMGSLRGSDSSSTSQQSQDSSALSWISPLLFTFSSSNNNAVAVNEAQRQRQKQAELDETARTIARHEQDLLQAMGLTGYGLNEDEYVGVEYTEQDRLSANEEAALESEHKEAMGPEEEDVDEEEEYNVETQDLAQDMEVDPELPQGFDVEFGRDD